ncbi:hypothetical protein FK545_14780 [Planococcus glaciei]|nr:hypothetical protein [Planococcus glaciei]QDY46177.1 hypothetical protein FK545_14780 [Planococcus glaciei]
MPASFGELAGQTGSSGSQRRNLMRKTRILESENHLLIKGNPVSKNQLVLQVVYEWTACRPVADRQ